MRNNAASVAKQYRLQQWVVEIESCKQRPADMTIKDWCQENGINRKSYYYHLNQVRRACLEQMSAEKGTQNIVAVPTNLLQGEERQYDVSNDNGLEISYGRYRVRIPEGTSPELLRMVLEVTTNVE